MSRLAPLVVLYVFIGLGCAAAMMTRRRAPCGLGRKVNDLFLMLVAWPLYAPFCFLATVTEAETGQGRRCAPSLRTDGDDAVDGDCSEDDLLDALRRAGGAPLASLLPDIETGKRLAGRLAVARRHMAEINALLAQERFSEQGAVERWEILTERGDKHAADLIGNRVQIIRRLGHMRDRFEREIEDIQEMLVQLEIQAEIVRMAGTASDDTRELVEDLMSRLGGLELMMEAHPTEETKNGDIECL